MSSSIPLLTGVQRVTAACRTLWLVATGRSSGDGLAMRVLNCAPPADLLL